MLWGGDDEEQENDANIEKPRTREVTVFGQWFYTIRENLKVIFGVFLGILALIGAIIFDMSLLAMGLGFSIPTFIVWFIYHWRNFDVPRTAVLDLSLSKGEVGTWLIPQKMMAEFDIEGNKQENYFRDQFSTPVLLAENVDLEDKKIEAAWAHDVSVWNLAQDEHALDVAKEKTMKYLQENAEFRNLMDLIIEMRLYGIRVRIQDMPLQDLLEDDGNLQENLVQELEDNLDQKQKQRLDQWQREAGQGA